MCWRGSDVDADVMWAVDLRSMRCVGAAVFVDTDVMRAVDLRRMRGVGAAVMWTRT